MSGRHEDAPEKSVQDFLQRWSRRKLGTAEAKDAAAPTEPSQSGEPKPVPPPQPADTAPEAPAAFDPKSLPPIESIDATTDIRAFLAPGIPVELSRAALRRAWISDPAIRDFVGLAENQWDFTNPDTVPGFGSLEFSEEVRAMVSRLFGETPAEVAQESAKKSDMSVVSERAATSAPEPETLPAVTTATATVGSKGEHAAPQNETPDQEREPSQRTHGGALPK